MQKNHPASRGPKPSRSARKAQRAPQSNPTKSGSRRKARSAPVALGSKGVISRIAPPPLANGFSYLSKGPSDRSVLIKRTTFLDIIATGVPAVPGTYDVTFWSVNPGLPNGVNAINKGPFTWIQGMANLYERYQIKSLAVRYVPSCPSTTPGDVLMCFDYDINDPSIATETAFLNTVGAKLSPVWTSSQINAVTRKNSRQLKCRSAAVPALGVRTDYDFATLYVATVGSPNSTVLGRLFLDYEVEFFLPTA